VEMNLRLPGQQLHAETGLHQNWMRDYDPMVGRYLQPDPIGLEGGPNVYVYVGSDPLNYVDPRGEDAVVLFYRPFFANFQHQDILVGDEKAGWTLLSLDGYREGCLCGSRSTDRWFPNLSQALADRRIRVATDAYRTALSASEDWKVKSSIRERLGDPYGFGGRNCGDVVRRGLAAVGIAVPDVANPGGSRPYFQKSHLWTPVPVPPVVERTR
jgi:RHS repeat-associated protein